MTSQNELGQENRFVCSLLPWLTALAALVVYLLTFNSWLSLNNLPNVARTSGWMLGPELQNPLWYLITYPFRWLPGPWVPLAYNVLALVCAVFTLVLLARSVALLPHDRTESQREREPGRFAILCAGPAWIPPVLAVIACGLQYLFWEDATSGSGDLFDLLLFAYTIRCLLEFRISDRDSWLLRAALVWAAGMANGWLMFCFFPFFLIALIWVKGLAFFNGRFLLRLLLCGLIGLLFYLVLPMIYVSSADSVGTFWQALRVNISTQRSILFYLGRQVPANILLLLAMSSILPVLVISIRWASNFGDPSRMGSSLATWIFHLAHAALLGVCVWVAFDPMFSPRHIANSIPLVHDYFTTLTSALYYLGALSIGYLSGYFLLVFKPMPDRMGRTIPLQEWLHRFSQACVCVLLVIVPAGLVCKNLPQIRVTNGPALKQYASLMVQDLPPDATIMSDPDDERAGFARKLILAQLALAGSGPTTNYFFLDTQLLQLPGYHALQQKRYPGQWPGLVNPKSTELVDGVTLITLIAKLAEKHPAFYLHPSFGYYFEYFYAQPHGLSYALKIYPTNCASEPPLHESVIADNEKFWNVNQAEAERLAPFIAPPPPDAPIGPWQKLMTRLHIPFEPNRTAAFLGQLYSQALNNWGVQLQRAGKLTEAAQRFRGAVALNPDNIAAKSNLEFNRELQSGKPLTFRMPRGPDDDLGKYRNLQQVVHDTGPFDDPTHCFMQGLSFGMGRNGRQAIREFERVHSLVPDNLRVRLMLAQLYIASQIPQYALDLLAGVHLSNEELAIQEVGKYELLQSKANALYACGKPAEAEQLLDEAVKKNPGDQDLLAAIVQLSTAYKRYTNALMAVDRHLQNYPDDASALVTKGFLHMQVAQYQEAIAPFSRVLSVQTNNYSTMLYRAVAYLSCDKVEEAEQDYTVLQKVFPNSIDVNSGLAEIAMRKKDTNSAAQYYSMCLANAAPGSDQAKLYAKLLQDIKGESP